MKAVRGTLLALGMAGATCLGAHAQSPEEVFERANRAYEAGRFAEAAEHYETVIRYGVRDARVEFNLANAYYKLGRLGLAILHYERARRLDPTDREVAANLELARERCRDRLPPPAQPAVLAALVALQDRLGPDRQAWLAVSLWWIVAGLLAWALARPGRADARWGWIWGAALLLLALVLCSWYTTHGRWHGHEAAVVLAPATEVRAGPGENHAVLFVVHEGLTVEIRSSRPGWVQVRVPNGLHGWLAAGALERV